jgi:hypothetical protein
LAGKDCPFDVIAYCVDIRFRRCGSAPPPQRQNFFEHVFLSYLRWDDLVRLETLWTP